MKSKSIFSITLAIILLGGSFGQFYINSVFAQNETNSQFESSDDVKTDQQEKTEKKQKELEQKKTDQQEKTEKKQKELEQKKTELQLHRKILEVKQMERSKEYEEKFAEIKDKNQNNTNQQQSNATENFSSKSVKLEEKLFKKSKEIRENLVLNSTKLDSRTQNILEKVNDGSYFGEKITNSENLETYELVFDSVQTSKISDNSQTSSLSGKMNFVAYDKGNSSLKLELLECHIVVDQTPFNCGFGKARTVSSGQSGLNDSLVIIAFLEDDVLKEIHTTMKIFLHSDTLIKDVETSQVSILGPQSQISHMWFLNGTATLSKIISSQEEIQIENNLTNSTLDKNSNRDP
jgi:Skp family chaperone for outer membrane proteins